MANTIPGEEEILDFCKYMETSEKVKARREARLKSDRKRERVEKVKFGMLVAGFAILSSVFVASVALIFLTI